MDQNPINFVGFNQDYDYILLGTSNGYTTYVVENDRISEKESNTTSSCMKVGRLYNSSLVVYVTAEDPRKLTLYFLKNNAVIVEVKFSNSILSFKINRKVIVVCTEEGIYIYDISNMKRKHKIEIDDSKNRRGIIALCSNEVSNLAYPASNLSGNIHVFNITDMKNVTILEAHNGLIAALEFNQLGDILATASDKGTVIRLFKIPSGEKFGEFRRGFARCATISCLSFSLDAQFLLACSNTETVHIFNLSQLSSNCTVEKDGRRTSSSYKDDYNSTNSELCSQTNKLFSYVGSALKVTSSYLPYPAQQMSEMLSQDRCFCVARLPVSAAENSITVHSKLSHRKVGAVLKKENGWRIVVATYDGFIYVFEFNENEGGEANLTVTYDIVKGKHYIRSSHGDSNMIANNSCNSIDSPISMKCDQEPKYNQAKELDLCDENEFPPIQKT